MVVSTRALADPARRVGFVRRVADHRVLDDLALAVRAVLLRRRRGRAGMADAGAALGAPDGEEREAEGDDRQRHGHGGEGEGDCAVHDWNELICLIRY